MRENPFREDREEIEELVRQYEDMKAGRGHSFLEEDAFERIIDFYDDHEQIPKAIEAAETGILQFPFSASLLIKKADLLIVTKKYREALNLLDAASLLDSGDINLYILKTDAFMAMERHEEAAALLLEALDLFEGEERIELLFELADVYDDYEEFDKLFECLKLILEDDPNNEEALYKICFWTDFTGRNEESIKLHNRIIEEFPYNELAWFNLGAAFQGLKLYEKAIDAYQYAIAIDEKFDYAYRNIGDAYIRLRKYKDAIEMLEKVVELSRPEDVIFEAIGFCYERLHNFPQARIHYRKAVHLSPDDSKLYFKIACTYMEELQWESAAKQLETALRLHRNVPDYNLAMGECKMELGEVKDAIQYFSLVVSARPRSASGWESLVKCLFRAGYLDEAEEQVNAAITATGGKPVFEFLKVGVLLALGKTKEALLCLETAMDKTPKMLKKLVELNPAVLQHQQVVDVVARFRKGNRFH